MERLREGEFLAGVFFHSFAADFAGRGGRGWRVVGDEGGDGFPVCEARGAFGGARSARIREGKTAGEGIGIGRRFFDRAGGEGESSGVARGTVEQAEDLRRDGGGVAALAGEIGRGLVEHFHRGIGEAANFQRVKAAAVALRRERIGNPRGSERAHHLARLERGLEIHLGAIGNAAERRVQLSGGREHRVAQFLGGEPTRGKGGVARARGIFFGEEFAVRVRGAATVDVARHDDAVEFFEGPALLDKRGGEPVEELGVRGFLAGAAEIIWVAGERLTEMPEPDAIHDGAGGERIFGGRDPLGKRGAAAFDGVGHGSFWRDTDGAEHAGRYFFTEGKRIAVG